MIFKQGDIVTYPNTHLFFQVARDTDEEGAIICKMIVNKAPYPMKMLTEGLIQASVH